jgi:hypothetical protein
MTAIPGLPVYKHTQTQFTNAFLTQSVFFSWLLYALTRLVDISFLPPFASGISDMFWTTHIAAKSFLLLLELREIFHAENVLETLLRVTCRPCPAVAKWIILSSSYNKRTAPS